MERRARAQRVSGVDALAIDLEVKLSALGARTDADIARAAENALSWSISVPDGYITLSGDVDWQFQRLAATESVRINAVADAKKILVGVPGADVTLTGKVQSWAEGETVKKSAWRTPGVRSVVDEMTLYC